MGHKQKQSDSGVQIAVLASMEPQPTFAQSIVPVKGNNLAESIIFVGQQGLLTFWFNCISYTQVMLIMTLSGA